MSLQAEIDKRRKEIHTDGYPMSIGELVNLYKDSELDLHPEFQRFYRWTEAQKSRWIESILLGIPLPSVFVVQREDGVWDVIDGLQRLSAIFELMGELKQEDGSKKDMLTLIETKYLPSLKGKRWKDSDESISFTSDQQRYIKRAKLDIKIIQRESHESAKYELFQRLNSGGAPLSDQEVRSCVLISANRDYYRWISDLSKTESFQECLPITDRQRREQYDLELAVRFVTLKLVNVDVISGLRELGEYITDQSVAQATNVSFKYDDEAAIFKETFDRLHAALEDDVFRRYEAVRDKFAGGFLISAFEVIAMGLGFNIATFRGGPAEIREKIKKEVWRTPEFLTSSGVRATQRLPRTIPFGRNVFEK